MVWLDRQRHGLVEVRVKPVVRWCQHDELALRLEERRGAPQTDRAFIDRALRWGITLAVGLAVVFGTLC